MSALENGSFDERPVSQDGEIVPRRSIEPTSEDAVEKPEEDSTFSLRKVQENSVEHTNRDKWHPPATPKDQDAAEAWLLETYLACQDEIVNFLSLFVSSGESGRELAQDTFVKALIAIRGGDRLGNGKGVSWLYTIARNTACDHLRRRKVIQFEDLEVVLRETPGDDQEMDRVVERMYLHEAMRNLPLEDVIVLILYHVQGYDYEDMSEVIQKSASGMKMRLMRARKKLKKILLEDPEG